MGVKPFSALLIVLMVLGFSYSKPKVTMHKIPLREFDLFALLGDTAHTFITKVRPFEISNFLTFGEYKKYLSSVKKDSSHAAYLSQLPDSHITLFSSVYTQYVTSTVYDAHPVLGISWDNAMNYCKWKTVCGNKKGDSIRFIYRLPYCAEWLSAYAHFTENKIPCDFNQYYSDWLITSKDESMVYGSRYWNEKGPEYIWLHKKDDPPSIKRKWVMGDSFLFQQKTLLGHTEFSYYANKGYRHISFRIVKEVLGPRTTDKKKKSRAERILNYWKLN